MLLHLTRVALWTREELSNCHCSPWWSSTIILDSRLCAISSFYVKEILLCLQERQYLLPLIKRSQFLPKLHQRMTSARYAYRLSLRRFRGLTDPPSLLLPQKMWAYYLYCIYILFIISQNYLFTVMHYSIAMTPKGKLIKHWFWSSFFGMVACISERNQRRKMLLQLNAPAFKEDFFFT